MKNTLRILHLEDDPVDSRWLKEILQREGLDVHIDRVDDLGSFIAQLSTRSHSLVISDFTLPGMDAFEALHAAQMSQPELPYLFFSGTLGEEAAIRALKAGATDYVLKDRPGRIASAVRKTLQQAERFSQRWTAEETRQFLPAIVSRSEDAILGYRLDGTVSSWNRGAEALFGYTAAEAVGRAVGFLIPPERQAEEAEFLSSVRQGREFLHHETLRLRKNGEPVPVSISLFPLKGEGGKTAGTALVARDLSERRGLERALRESEAKFRAIFQQAGIGIARGSFSDARWIDVNDAFCRMLGYSRDELQNKRWSTLIHPEDLDLDLPLFRRMAAGELESYTVEKRFFHKQGHQVWARLTLSLVRDDRGRPESEIAVIEDITHRKQAEALLRRTLRNVEVERSRLAAVFEALPAGVAIADASGKVRQFNAALARIWGSPPSATSVADYSAWRGYWVDSGKPLAAEDWAMARALRTGQVVPGDVIEIEKFGSSERAIILNAAAPIRDPTGQIIGGVVAEVDITAQKRAEAALERARRDLAEANAQLEQRVTERTARLKETIAELEQMSYSMIHDLRAPLRAIESFGDIIAEDPGNRLTEEGREMMGKMRAAARRMDHLVRDVLNYAHVVGAELPLSPVDLDHLARGIVETYPKLTALGAQIQIAPDLPRVLGNEAALTQCLSQLLDNAVKFAKPDTPARIRIGCEIHDESVRVMVEDNGIGISHGALPKVFGLMQQLSNTEGTGVGLAIVKKAVERMGGRVGVDSVPGQGSRFWFELKRA